MPSPDDKTSSAKDATVKESGDNRGAGDQDGNAAAGSTKSPGVTEPETAPQAEHQPTGTK